MVNMKYRKMLPVLKKAKYERKVLSKGSVNGENALPLLCDVLFEKDVAVPMRDGVKLYTDIFRPAGTEKVPAIIAWSPYGKTFRGDEVCGIQRSNLQKFEAPDPAFWVNQGYAIINIDSRGIGNSEGQFVHWSKALGRDGYDTVEWIANQEWSNGHVGLAGNSYLAISQWFIAAERPPHLFAIAPWEGFSDVFHESVCPGGIPDTEMLDICEKFIFKGRGKLEVLSDYAKKNPYLDEVWKEKIAAVEDIEVPAYVVASYANKVHGRGTLESFEKLGSKKWLRIHNTHEWKDFYTHQDELLLFFDHFLKNIDNGWEKTPKVRVSILNPGGKDVVEKAEAAYPPENIQSYKCYFDSASKMIKEELPGKESVSTYLSNNNKDSISFIYKFKSDTDIMGSINIKLWVSAQNAKDMDIFVTARKLDKNGEFLPVMVYGAPYCKKGEPAVFEWGNGRCRASARVNDYEPHYLKENEIIPVNIKLCQMGMHFDKGQQMEIIISGYNIAVPELSIQKQIKPMNKGIHKVYTGGKYDSSLVIPIYDHI